MDVGGCRAPGGVLKSIRSLNDAEEVFRDRAHAAQYLLDMGVLDEEVSPRLIAIGPGGLALAREMSKLSGVRADLVAVAELSPAWQGGPVFGAAAFDGTIIFDEDMKEICSVSRAQLHLLVTEAYERVAEIAQRISSDPSSTNFRGATVVVVDDGLSAPLAINAAIAAARNAGAQRVVLAIPVAERRWVKQCAENADLTHCASLHSVPTRRMAAAYSLWSRTSGLAFQQGVPSQELAGTGLQT